MTFATVQQLFLCGVLLLFGTLLIISLKKRKKLNAVVLIPCIILAGILMVLSFRNNSPTGHIQNFQSYSIADLSSTCELTDQSLMAELADSAVQETINQTQISNFDVSFHDGSFSNLTYSFLVATDTYPLERIVQINYVGDIFSEPSRGTKIDTYTNQLMSYGDLKKALEIISDSQIIQDISSKSSNHIELSFIGIIDLETASHGTEQIYVIIENKIMPLSDIENGQQASYFVFNIISDTDNLWICY